MKQLLPLFVLLFWACAKDTAPDYTIQLTAVKLAFEQKKIDTLKPYLANGFTIKGIPAGFEPMLLPVVLQKLPAPTKITITSETKEKMGTRIKATFYGAGEKPIATDFLIASDGKFLELNLLNDAKITTE